MFDLTKPFSNFESKNINGANCWIMQSQKEKEKILSLLNKNNYKIILKQYNNIIKNLTPFDRSELNRKIDLLKK